MVKQATLARTPDLEPIDRLEEKVKRLVDMVVQLRADLQRAADNNSRLTEELQSLRARLVDADQTSTELTAMREERDVIRTRVAEMLEQLEGI
jgi:regulator of replication initiation timing